MGEEKSHGVIRHLIRAVVRHIGHGDAQSLGGGYVDIVVADPVADDRSAPASRSSRYYRLPHRRIAGHDGRCVTRFGRQCRLVR